MSAKNIQEALTKLVQHSEKLRAEGRAEAYDDAADRVLKARNEHQSGAEAALAAHNYMRERAQEERRAAGKETDHDRARRDGAGRPDEGLRAGDEVPPEPEGVLGCPS